jgi:flagellar biosynthesis protein FlhA
MSDVIRRHAHELIGRQEVQELLNTLKETHPKVIEELIPNTMSLGGVVKVLQNLLIEQVQIRDLLTVVEAMADWAPSVKQIDQLTEYVRQALSRTITRQYMTPEGELKVITLSHPLERELAEAIQRTDHGEFLAIDPHIAQQIMRRTAEQLEKFGPMNLQPLILCSAPIRPHLKKLADRFIPNLVVISYDEVETNVRIQSIGMVEFENED